MAELTPMMKQYLQIKQENPDCILFFRLGDFYEMFCEDAKLASKELDLALTTRDRNKDAEDQTPMCGIPYHSSESYIARLVAKGYKVAICEQMEDPALAKGLVKREVTRLVTPGTVTEASMLDASRNNYFACIYGEEDRYGLCFCDISTGSFYATGAAGDGARERIENELGRFSPSEALCYGTAKQDDGFTNLLSEKLGCMVDPGAEILPLEQCQTIVETQFGTTCQELGIGARPEVVISAGLLLTALQESQKADLRHIRTLDYYLSGKFMELDLAARQNLELTQTLRSKEKWGSLLWVLDKTKTAMGSRLLRGWLEKPLLAPDAINRRLDAVEELVTKTVPREEIIVALKEVTDIERTMARIVTGTAGCRDLIALSCGSRPLPDIRALLSQMESPLLREIYKDLDTLDDLRDLIDQSIAENPPFSVREGNIIRKGYHEEVDRLRDILSGGKGSLAAIEAKEKEATGIPKLKVGYNRVFGYYIEVSKSYTSLVPDSYIRRQTLANCERYITPDLKELETTILTAKDRIVALEFELFTQIRLRLADKSQRVQTTCQAVAALDTLCCFAANAVRYNYCRPQVDLSGSIQITQGRHPVVEQVLKGSLFVPNDTNLDTGADPVAIITGPNMAGKSTYMRQVALIVLMAQMGSFVPAKSAKIGIVDQLFTRIGASDDLASGQSTFMVEMTEVANILRYATSRSLLILDEIGRGTSTFDGMAIARAVLEYCADPKRLGAKTLFATHYHELTVLEDELPGVRNYNIAVKKRGGDIIFLRKIIPGAADDSFGVEVAKLAGIPEPIIKRAHALLRQLEQHPEPETRLPLDNQITLMDLGDSPLRKKLSSLSVETMTPIEAMNALYELKQLL